LTQEDKEGEKVTGKGGIKKLKSPSRGKAFLAMKKD